MKPKQMFFVMIGVLGITIAAGIGVFYWSSGRLEESSLAIGRLKSENDILDLRIATVNNAQLKLSELSDIREDVTNILPPDKIQSDIVAQILKIASDNGIQLNNINFPSSSNPDNFDISQTEPLKGVAGVRYTTINTDFTTSYGQLLNFLEQIEENQRLMQVSNVNITPNPSGSFGVNLGIQIYVKG